MKAMLCWNGQFWRPINVPFLLLLTHWHTINPQQNLVVLLHAAATLASGIGLYNLGGW